MYSRFRTPAVTRPVAPRTIFVGSSPQPDYKNHAVNVTLRPIRGAIDET